MTKEDKHEVLQERILLKASEMFRLNGIKCVTMDDVAQRIGISKRTLYEYYPNKEVLLKASYMKDLQNMVIVERMKDWEDSNIVDMMFLFYQYTKRIAPLINRNYFRDMKKFYPKIYALADEHREQQQKKSTAIIQRGIEDGLIRQEVNPELSSLLLKFQFESLWFSDDMTVEKYSIAEVISMIILNFLRGILTEEGLKRLDKLLEEDVRDYEGLVNE